MKQQAIDLGFYYSRKGCSCSGSPSIYAAVRNNIRYELTLYESRDTWKLTANNTSIAEGDAANLTTKIQEIWDSSKI